MGLVSLGDYAGCNIHYGSHFIFVVPFCLLWVCIALIQKANLRILNNKQKKKNVIIGSLETTLSHVPQEMDSLLSLKGAIERCALEQFNTISDMLCP